MSDTDTIKTDLDEAVARAIEAEQLRVVRATLDYEVGPIEAKEQFFREAGLTAAYEAVRSARESEPTVTPGYSYAVEVWRPTDDLEQAIKTNGYNAVVVIKQPESREGWRERNHLS